MYSLAKKIQNIKYVTPSNYGLSILDKDFNLFLNENDLFNSNPNYNSLIFFDNCLLALDFNNKIIDSYPRKIHFEFPVFKISSKDKLGFYIKTKPDRTYGVYDGEKIILQSDKLSKDFKINNDNIFGTKNKAIYFLKNLSDETWTFQLSKLISQINSEDDEVASILGVSNNNLWFYTKYGRLIAINIANGEIVKKLSGSQNDILEGFEIHDGFGDVYLNENDGYIYCFSDSQFKKVNTRTLKVEETNKFREIDPSGIGKFDYVFSPLLQGQYFTFLGQKNNEQGIRHVGLFNWLKKKLVWEYEIISEEEKNKGNTLIRPQPLRMSGDKLYIKDIQDTLYIFEKEQDIA